MANEFAVFADRAKSLLVRWEVYLKNNPSCSDAQAIKACLMEINDGYTSVLIDAGIKDEPQKYVYVHFAGEHSKFVFTNNPALGTRILESDKRTGKKTNKVYFMNDAGKVYLNKHDFNKACVDWMKEKHYIE